MKKYLYGQNRIHIAMSAFIGFFMVVFAIVYFKAYADPFMQQNLLDISDGWQYRVGSDRVDREMGTLHQVDVPAGETLILTRPLKEHILEDAALMLKSNHQQIKVLLDNELLFENTYDRSIRNPGMALHFINLPEEYWGKLLRLEITSPYADYSGAPGSVYLGDIESLTAYASSRSMLHLLLMVVCLSVGAFMMVIAVLNRTQDGIDWGNFLFGVYSVLWGFYFPSGDFIAHQFFSPQWVSWISIGLYYLYPLPLLLYFYFQFNRYRKAMLPIVVLRGLFVVVAFSLQFAGIADFPEMLGVNNPLLVLSIVYLIVLGFMEMKKGNRFLRVTIPWMLLTFLISIQSMISFYTTRIKQDQTIYELAMFMMIMVVWTYNLIEFLRTREQERSALQILRLKNELALQSHETVTRHFQQVAALRHEMKNHIIAMQILMSNKEYGKVAAYLSNIAEQQEQIPQGRYCEHYLVNALLSVRLPKLEEAGVRISHKISVPQDLGISDEELSSLIMNLLDNATEALMAMPEDIDRRLELRLYMQKPYLYIFCQNTKSTQVRQQGENYLSTKANSRQHGYGLKIIRSIVERREGIFHISHTADCFTVEAAVKENRD